jgi:cell division protease FtsH
MNKEKGRNSRQDNRGNNPGYNYLLYAMVLGLVVMFGLMYFTNISVDEITYDDLLKLIEATKYVDKTENSHLVDEYTGTIYVPASKGVTYEYSRLHGVVVGPRSITGEVHRKEEKPDVETSAAKPRRFRTNIGDDETTAQELSMALKGRNIDWRHSAPASIWKAWAPMFLITGLFILLFVMMLRRLGGAGSPMAFGRSRGRLYAQEDLGVTFDDAAGIEEAVEEVKEVVDFLKSAEKYQRLGARIPKGVLLIGPPGTGKTLLAKAIAGEAGVPFFSLSGSDFVEMFVGVGAARVRDMFEQAVAKAPCIIFIDEMDALGKMRGTSMVGGHDEREQTLNALLVEMDGFDSNSGVIVLAATNRPEMLDEALLRPGRFDRQVLVDRPDVHGREEILKVHVKNVKLDDSVQLKEIAGISPGFVGADLANLVNEATLLAARKDKSSVGMAEFNEGVERVIAGLEKKQRVMNEDEKHRVAYHEAGHALVAYCLPNTDRVHKVSIIPRGFAALGYTLQRPDGDRYLMTQSELESRIKVLLAGTVTEELIFDDVSTGAQNDLERATDIARAMVMDYGMSQQGRIAYRESTRSPFLPSANEERSHTYSEHTAREIDAEVKRILNESLDSVREILESRRDALVAVAEELIVNESMEGADLKRIVDENSSGPQLVPGTTETIKRGKESGERPEGGLRSAGDP